MRGGEKCLELLAGGFPRAPIYTLIHNRAAVSDTINRHAVHASPLQHVPGIFRTYRYFLPLFPLMERLFAPVSADLLISTSHCAAKALRARPGARHLCYCFTPMRYAWSFHDEYLGAGSLKQRLASPVLGALRRWDRRVSDRVDRFIGISRHVCDRIRRLDPRPGWRHGPSQVAYVVPDVVARKLRGQWSVQLNPAIVPRVRLNQVYAQLFQRHRSAHNTELGAHLSEARWTLHNVEQRFSTILDVARAIVKRQHSFLDYGSMAMKPMGLREIADELGIHESTVSRVTNNKYIATPNGVFELKHFFSRAMISANGSACSGTAIRGLIKDIIDAEQAEAPLSDAEITRQLAQQGLMVARRTVTKYRQMLKIAAVERRRRHS